MASYFDTMKLFQNHDLKCEIPAISLLYISNYEYKTLHEI